MMGQFKQVLGLSVQDWLVVVRLGVSTAELRVPSLSLDSIVTGSHQALLTLIDLCCFARLRCEEASQPICVQT